MRNHRSITALFLISLVARIASELDYSELEALGVTCPERDKCEGQAWQDRTYMERNCECDAACHSYGDCCIDAGQARRSASSRLVQRTDKVCMNFGVGNHTGVYVVAHCSSSWNGSQTVREKCEGPTDFSDPMVAAPVTSIAQSVTYRNLFCAECNYANMQYLKTFQFQLACDGLDDMTEAQIIGDLFYDQQRAKWGVNRSNDERNSSFEGCTFYERNDERNSSFKECNLYFDVPDSTIVRFCRPHLVSSCARDWNRTAVKARCEAYMAVAHDYDHVYRNPYCALCNFKSVADLWCGPFATPRERPFSLLLITDVGFIKICTFRTSITRGASIYEYAETNFTDFPKCNSGQKYDPFFKMCRNLLSDQSGFTTLPTQESRSIVDF